MRQFGSPIEEYYKTFSDDTRVLNTHKVETVIQEMKNG